MYPDIFESATFSFRIQKFPCPHKAKMFGFAGCVWTEAVPGKLGTKKLRIENYPDASGRFLSASYFERERR